MRKLYIAWTYHHIIISSLKAIKDNCVSDIILVKKQKALDNEISERILESGIFNNVYEWNEENVPVFGKKKIFHYLYYRYIGLKKYYDKFFPVDIFEYDNCYLFVDFDTVGMYFDIKKCNYHLIEDAPKIFTKQIINRPPALRLNRINPSGINKFLQYCRFEIPIYGNSRYCLDIEVDNLDDLFLTKHNFCKFFSNPQRSLFSSVTEEEKKIILNIFLTNMELSNNKNYLLILTEPLFDDCRISSIEEQFECYKKIIKLYGSDKFILIKPHPRDLCDYKALENSSVILLKRTFPSEVFELMPEGTIEKYLTISSAAIYAYPEDKRIYLGEEFLKEFIEKNENKYEKSNI